MLRDALIFGAGLLVGLSMLLALFRLPYWIHEHTRKRALRARRDDEPQRWLH